MTPITDLTLIDRKYLQSLQAEVERLRWQPIETAPKDGTRVIVSKFAWVVREVQDIFREDAERIWHLCFVTTAHFLSDKSYWTDGLERLVEPTHWMPLPDPPSSSKENDNG